MFPAPFPTNNPYVGAAAEAGSAAARLAEGLRAAYVQQQGQIQRAQQAQVVQDHQDQQDRFHALQDGWIPADTVTQDPSGLKVRKSVEGQDPSRVMNIGGQRLYRPTPTEAEAAKLDDTNSFVPTGQLGAMLESAGHKPGARIKASDSHAILQALNEAQKDGPWRIDTSGNFHDANGKSVAVMIHEKTGQVKMLDLSGTGAQGGAPGGPFDGQRQQGGGTPMPQQGAPRQGGGAVGSPYDTPDDGPDQMDEHGKSGGLPGGPFDTSGGPELRGPFRGVKSTQGAVQTMPFSYTGGPVDEAVQPLQSRGGGASGGAFSFALPEKAEKPDAQSIIPGMQGAGGGILVLNKDRQSVDEIPVPKGSKRTMTPAQEEADKDRHVRQSELQDAREQRQAAAEQRRADAQAKVEEQYARTHEAAGVKKDAMQAMAQGYWDAKGTEPNGTYFPPRYVNGIVVPGPPAVMPDKGDAYDARLKELETMARGFEKTAKTHQAEQERIEKARGWGRFAPAQQPAQTTPAAGSGRGAKADPLGIR